MADDADPPGYDPAGGLVYNATCSSDLPFGSKHTHPCGVFFVSDSSGIKTPYRYCMEDRTTYAEACSHFREHGFDTFSFCPYTNKANFVKFYTYTDV
jgi:hypothetical protein